MLGSYILLARKALGFVKWLLDESKMSVGPEPSAVISDDESTARSKNTKRKSVC